MRLHQLWMAKQILACYIFRYLKIVFIEQTGHFSSDKHCHLTLCLHLVISSSLVCVLAVIS